MIDYRSDNTGRAAPQILEALVRANHDTALGYGGDQWTAALQQRFSELFETSVRVFPVATGTAANALALAALGPSWGIVYCSEIAHINTSEANATGFFGGGTKLAQSAGSMARSAPTCSREALAGISPGQLHRGQPVAVSLTQATDLGAVYTVDEIQAVAELAKRRGLRLHMDGARFANAIARLGCHPADPTWRSGIDIMSFGATKNGGALCDAIVVFSPDLANGLAVQLRRAGQVWSKMRFASAQLIAYLENSLWLDMGRASNAIAARIAAGLQAIPDSAGRAGRGKRDLSRASRRCDGRARSGRVPVLPQKPQPRPFRVPVRHDGSRGGRACGGAWPPSRHAEPPRRRVALSAPPLSRRALP